MPTIDYTFNPSVHPDFGYQRSLKPRVLKAEFGDGYIQRAADGTNTMPITSQVTWSNVTETERDEIIDFFAARRGYQSFFYTYQDEDTPKVYVCEEWSYTHADAAHYTVTATLKQVFDLYDPPFDMTDAFFGGHDGVYWNPTDTANIFQLSGGTTAGVVGQPVGYATDLSGNGNHLTQSTSGLRTTLTANSMLFDGIDDWMQFAPQFHITWTAGTAVLAVKATGTAGTNWASPLGFFTNGGGAECYPIVDGRLTSSFLRTTGKDCGDPGDITQWHTVAIRSEGTNWQLWFNGVLVVDDTASTFGVTSNASYPRMGDNGFGTTNFKGEIGIGAITDYWVDDTMLADMIAFAAAGYGG
jgi:phage-related protein